MLGSILHSVHVAPVGMGYYNLRVPVLHANVILINCLANVPSLRGGGGGGDLRVYHGETSQSYLALYGMREPD